MKTMVSLEEYLKTPYDPDCDYVDGELLERNVGERDHSDLQGEVLFFFRSRRKQWETFAFPEQRVQVSATRFRVPDVCVYLGRKPEDQIFKTPPFICVEILSPEDRWPRVEKKLGDYAVSSETSAIVLRDTAGKVALAEKIVASMNGSPLTSSLAISSGTFPHPWYLNARNARIRQGLDLRSTAPVSLRINQQGVSSFETLCATVGVRCEFHRQIAKAAALSFTVENVDIFTALDQLAFQTGNFWQVQDPHTIMVATDNPTVRREVEPTITRTIYLENIKTREGITDVVFALQTLVSVNEIEPNSPNGVTMTATADKIELAQRLVGTLDVAGRSPLQVRP